MNMERMCVKGVNTRGFYLKIDNVNKTKIEEYGDNNNGVISFLLYSTEC